ncbi:MAG: double-strand break repair protein AddB [Pseudomonadota bacterium]
MASGLIWGIDPGTDFPMAFVAGLSARFEDQPPEALARTRVYLNSGRMLRRVKAAFASGPARLLPRLGLVTDLGRDVALGPLPPARSSLARRLELTQLVDRLLAAEPDLAPRAVAFDLATSLTRLLDEMQGEGVSLEKIAALDISDLSGHWARSQRFLNLLSAYLSETGAPPDAEGRQRLAVETLLKDWEDQPPAAPVIIAGSTGSRGTTRKLMEGVLRLSQGHVVLPGFDFAMPHTVWHTLRQPQPQEDHPQYRFADLMAATGKEPEDIARWWGDAPPSPARNAMVSLALRPAPVTDSWQTEGPDLGDLATATSDICFVEAADPREEATAIALILRAAAEENRPVALISPDRMLTRRVAALLDRWGIVPDDSGGEPLTQSAAGRLLRQIAALWTQPLEATALIALLKHPLSHSNGGRNQHLLFTRDYEVWQRRSGPAFLTGETLRAWAKDQEPKAQDWADWIGFLIDGLSELADEAPLAERVSALLTFYELLVAGAEADPQDPHTKAQLWQREDGKKAARKLDQLSADATAGGNFTAAGFAALLQVHLTDEVRNPTSPHPGVMIWGTLEARVQGAELVVLGGLNEGIWPPAPDPDPWLNRRMRAEAGLLSPERRIGLSAHDFQQAAAAPQVVLTRAKRDGQAPMVPARWLNRLTTLIQGLPDQRGPEALAEMHARGNHWLQLSRALDRPKAWDLHLPRAPRPSIVPPAGTAPERLSVSDVESLIRDPYAIYASRHLKLRPLLPLTRAPDPTLRGTVLHRALEIAGPDLAQMDPAGLMRATDAALEALVPWPHIRALWQARMARITDWFLRGEKQRLISATPAFFEADGRLPLGTTGVTLSAKADRIDLRTDGQLNLYDYKTGSPPSEAQQLSFNKQLLLVAAMAEAGGFQSVGRQRVAQAEYLGLGPKPKVAPAPLVDAPPAETLARTAALLAAHIAGTHGYTAKRAPEKDAYGSVFDHLSRFGEWETTDPAERIEVGDHG